MVAGWVGWVCMRSEGVRFARLVTVRRSHDTCVFEPPLRDLLPVQNNQRPCISQTYNIVGNFGIVDAGLLCVFIGGVIE